MPKARRMRVAVVIDSLLVGGAQKLVSTFATSSCGMQIEPTVVSLSDKNDKAIVESIEKAGVRIVQFPARSLKDLDRLRRLVCFFSFEKFDLIHTHLAYANILGSMAGFITRIPVVATLHSTGYDPGQKSALFQTLENTCLRYLVSRIVVVGTSVMEVQANRIGRRRLDLIPNAVPTQEPVSFEIRQKKRRELLEDPGRCVIISVGRFVQAKAHEDMIDAFLLAHRNHPETILVLAGSGILFPKIQMKVKDLQLTDSIYLLGERNDIPQLLAASDVFASSSHREGLPVSVLEAMMAGLPVVGTNVGEMAHIVTNEIGRIVPPHHPELLAGALDEMLDDPDKLLVMGKNARLRAVQEYSVETWMARHTDLYNEILDSKGDKRPQ
jgi:glycosyltransferase involved in cell wall biosynthesis